MTGPRDTEQLDADPHESGQPAKTLRIATYNVERFNTLFDDDGAVLEDDLPSSRYGVSRAQQAGGLATVFRALEADLVMVIEAPDTSRQRQTVTALEGFATRFKLRTRRALIGYANATQQEIACLYDPDRLAVRHDPKGIRPGQPGAAADPRFDGHHRISLSSGAAPDAIRFNKPPLELALTTAAGAHLRLIGVHMKSKAPHGARTPEAVARISVANRREHLAQCLWLRERVLQHLAAGDPLIVLGDFNDGPGLDAYEQQFGRSGLEIVLGWNAPRSERLYDPHARLALASKLALRPTSARFYMAEAGRYFSALLDYIMVSPDMRAKAPRWRIWHPFEDPECFANPALSAALLAASDHFPVSLDLAL